MDEVTYYFTPKDLTKLLEKENLPIIKFEKGGYENKIGKIKLNSDFSDREELFILSGIWSYLKKNWATKTINLLEEYIDKIK